MSVSPEHAAGIRACWPRRHHPAFRRMLRTYVIAERIRRIVERVAA